MAGTDGRTGGAVIPGSPGAASRDSAVSGLSQSHLDPASTSCRGCCGWVPLVGPKTRRELESWATIAWPVSCTLGARLSMQIVDLAFVGRLSTQDLAAASLAFVWMLVTSSFVWMGVGGALNTLSSQAFGAKSYKLVGVWLQIAILLSTALCAAISVAWWFTEPVLRFGGFDATQAQLAGTFARYSILGLWPNVMYTLVRLFLLAQQDVIPSVIVAVVCAMGNVGLNQLFIHGAFGWDGLGFIGSPIATATTRVLLLVMLGTYAFCLKRYKHPTWSGWSRGCLVKSRWHSFVVTQALPQMISAALEEWQLQVIAFLAARLGEVQIATHNSVINLFYVLTSMMYGMISATNIRIAFHLGGGHVRAAKRVVAIAGVACSFSGVAVAMVFIFGRDYIGRVFSNDPAVWAMAKRISLLVGAGYAALAIFYVSMATLSGAGRPNMVAVSFVIGAWLVCVPLAFVFTDVIHQGLLGLWHALVAGYITVTLIAGVSAIRLDWNAAVDAARVRAEAKPLLGQADADTASPSRRDAPTTKAAAADQPRSYHSHASEHESSGEVTPGGAAVGDAVSGRTSRASARRSDAGDVEGQVSPRYQPTSYGSMARDGGVMVGAYGAEQSSHDMEGDAW